MADEQEALELESLPGPVEHDSSSDEADVELDRPASLQDEQGKRRHAQAVQRM